MKGDFSRISFDAKNHFSQVLMQQGRVTLDADPNEQGAILLHYLRTLARDIIGPYGGPLGTDLGFTLIGGATSGKRSLKIGAGRYYVDGILVENEVVCEYADQPDYTPAADDALLVWLNNQSGDVWLYLDVWERHVSAVENDAIRESALGGPDTCSRAEVVWQVRGVARDTLLSTLKVKLAAVQAQFSLPNLSAEQKAALQTRLDRLNQDIKLLTPTAAGQVGSDCAAPLDALGGVSDAWMTAGLDPGQQIKDPCVLAPDAQYRGVENQLYRVEIHRGGSVVAGKPGPTFKWSRDNGSVATRWLGTEGADLVVDNARGFTSNAWVELTGDSDDLLGRPGVLVKLTNAQAGRLSVDLDSLAGATMPSPKDMKNAKVRRWDQTETDDITLDAGAVPLVEASATDTHWIALEDGIQVQFSAGGTYRSGDYWLIPARVVTGSIEWPHTELPNTAGKDEIKWLAQAPRGVEHHYAPLGWALAGGSLTTCQCTIRPINSCSLGSSLAPAPGNRLPKAPAKPKPKPPAPA